MCVSSSIPSFGFVGMGLSTACVYVSVINFPGLEFSFYYLPIKGWLYGLILFKFDFIMEYLVFSMLTESFTGFSSLGWPLWSPRICNTFVQDFLAFIVYVEKSGMILTTLI